MVVAVEQALLLQTEPVLGVAEEVELGQGQLEQPMLLLLEVLLLQLALLVLPTRQTLEQVAVGTILPVHHPISVEVGALVETTVELMLLAAAHRLFPQAEAEAEERLHRPTPASLTMAA